MVTSPCVPNASRGLLWWLIARVDFNVLVMTFTISSNRWAVGPTSWSRGSTTLLADVVWSRRVWWMSSHSFLVRWSGHSTPRYLLPCGSPNLKFKRIFWEPERHAVARLGHYWLSNLWSHGFLDWYYLIFNCWTRLEGLLLFNNCTFSG